MSKVKINGNVLSIQLGRYETRIALMGKGSEILHTACVPTPEGAVEDGMIQNADAVRSMLTAALGVPEFKKCRQAVFSLCTSQVITETAVTPSLPEARLEKLLQANVDTYFQVDMREYRLAWQVVSTRKNELGATEANVRLWAVPTAMISRYYAVANACGLSVAAIDYCGNSIAGAVGASFAQPAKSADKGKKKLNLNAEISFGKKKEAEAPAETADDFYATPDTDLHLTLEQDLIGMTFVQNSQVVFQRFILCGDDPSMQLDELAMMLEYFRSMDQGRGSEIRGVVSGTLARDRSLTEGLQDVLGIDLTTFAAPYDQQWLLCVGASKTGLDFGVPSLNAPGKNYNQVNATLWQYGLVLLGGIALVLVIMMTLSARLLWTSEITVLQSNMQALTLRAQKTAGFADNYKNYANAYDNYSNDWDTVFASLRTYNDNLVLVLEELEEILPEKASVTDMNIAVNGLQVEFACETKEEAAYLIMALRELTYADVIMIDNLRGGGGGAATSYGPDGTENAPTEGDYDPASSQAALEEFIASELSQDELAELAMTLTPEQIELLEQVYGKPAVTKSASLTALQSSNSKAASFDVRDDALRTMLTSNPIAMEKFVGLVEEDFYAPQPILWNYILMDLMLLMESGAFGDGSVSDAETMMAYMDILLDVLTKDEPTLAAVEKLICEDPELEMWYVYYLETHESVKITAPSPVPYLNVDQVTKDVMTGGFKTGDPDLDAKLDSLISDETWALIDKLNTPEGVSDLIDQYMTTGTTGNIAIDAMIDSYLATGTTGVPAVDKKIQECIDNGQLDEILATMLDNYMTTGSTGLPAADDMLNKYLATGTTGNEKLDQVIADYITSGAMDEVMVELMNLYLTTGSTGIGALDLMIEQYLATGTTGNPELDAIVEEQMKEFFTDTKVAELISKYMTTGTTGIEALDDLIERYTTTGTTGNKWLDDLIKQYMDSLTPDVPGGSDDPIIGDYTTEDLMDMLKDYLVNGTTGNLLLDMMIEQFLATGTTGNDKWDDMIKDYINSGKLDKEMEDVIKDYDDKGTTGSSALDKLLNNYKNNGYSGNALLDRIIKKFADILKDDTMTDDEFDKLMEQLQNMNKPGNGTGTGNGTAVQDTRIFFTVVLAYNDELKNAELERKGLYYDDKLTKLEVAE